MPTHTNSLAFRLRRPALTALFAVLCAVLSTAPARADLLHMADGQVVEVDEAWEDGQGVWYRRGRITQLVERARVRKIERVAPASTAPATDARQPLKVEQVTTAPGAGAVVTVSVYFVGGAHVEADE